MQHALRSVLLPSIGALALVAAPALGAASNSSGNTGNTAVDAPAPTFHGEVSRILQAECQVCHRPGGANLGGMVAPMSLVSYDETRPWARSIAKKVASREMPPWHASPEQAGLFHNERTLSDEQIDTLVRWAKAGAPAGDVAAAPPALEWPDDGGWMIGEPDLVLTVDEPFFVDDDVEDQYVYLKTTMTEDLLPEDRYVKAIEFRPGSSVVHHIIVPGLGGIAPGNDPAIYRDGIASVLKAGKDLQWQMHYHKEPGPGTGVWEQSKVALKFYDSADEVKYTMQNADLGRFDFVLPPGESEVTTSQEFTFPVDSRIVSYLPHMHLRGKWARYTAFYPDGTSEVLLDVPRYDFNWQTAYEYETFKQVPAGTRVVFESAWDNSADNPYNPDPTTTVRWGEPTTDEMSFGFMSFINEENSGGNLFGQNGLDVTAIVAFSDKSRDGKMQLDEAPEQVKAYFAMMDTSKDGAVDMDEARAANAFLEKQFASRRSAQAGSEESTDAPAADESGESGE
ncbi:MAG: alkyl hydroperoxide reductase [Acidobacteria bacterium]|nr:MAG: alkyl hydroperoxide reductase [Acidobacteriota bacterium]